jgi:hypothetical protein
MDPGIAIVICTYISGMANNLKMYSVVSIHYDARVTLKTYLPVKRIGNKFLVLPGHHNG